MRFLDIVRRHGHDHADATEHDDKRRHRRHQRGAVKRCHSYHDIEQAAAAVLLGSASNGKDERGGDLAAMSTAAAVSSNGPVTHHLAVEEDHTRQRKSSGGSHHHLFSLGLRFGGKGKSGDKKKKDKKGDLPSPAAPDTSFGDPDLTIYR